MGCNKKVLIEKICVIPNNYQIIQGLSHQSELTATLMASESQKISGNIENIAFFFQTVWKTFCSFWVRLDPATQCALCCSMQPQRSPRKNLWLVTGLRKNLVNAFLRANNYSNWQALVTRWNLSCFLALLHWQLHTIYSTGFILQWYFHIAWMSYVISRRQSITLQKIMSA